MSMESFTLFHVALSLAGIFAGFLVMGGMLCAQRMPRLTAVFLVTTTLTSVTGFFFPAEKVLPAHVVGVLSLVLLAAALAALYYFKLKGRWRTVYVVCALAAQFFNVFVLVVQMFQKVPALAALAPMQTGPYFAATQGVTFALFVLLGWRALGNFRAA